MKTKNQHAFQFELPICQFVTYIECVFIGAISFGILEKCISCTVIQFAWTEFQVFTGIITMKFQLCGFWYRWNKLNRRKRYNRKNNEEYKHWFVALIAEKTKGYRIFDKAFQLISIKCLVRLYKWLCYTNRSANAPNNGLLIKPKIGNME